MGMTPTTKQLMEQVASWPEEDQEELAEFAREIEARRTGVYPLSEEERAGIERGLQAMREGRFASEERVAAIFAKARSLRK
jgi:predicted transcriptional regulator